MYLLLYLLSLPLSTGRMPRRQEYFHPIRATCFNIDLCRQVSSDSLCDLECSSAECGLDGGDCDMVTQRDGKMLLVLHISPSRFLLVSHIFLSDMSSITGSLVEIDRESLDLLIWEWTPESGPHHRLYLETQSSPPDIGSIQVMISLRRGDCSRECTSKIEESMRLWHGSVKNEDLSPFMAELLYGEKNEEDSSHWTLIFEIGMINTVHSYEGVTRVIRRWNKSRNVQSTVNDTPSYIVPSRGVSEVGVNRVDKGQTSPLHSLISSSNQSIEEDIRALIKCGECVNTVDREGRSLLHMSILHSRSSQFLEWLITMGVSLSIVDDKYQTILHVAVSMNDLRVLSILLEIPSIFRMIDNCDYRNMSALKLSMSGESTDISRLLIQYGASVNLCGLEGDDPLLCHRSPLHIAVMNNHMEQVELLLEKGADVNIVDDGGLTPLHYAVIYCGREMVVRLVKEENCNVLRRDRERRTAEEVARMKGKIEIVNILKEAFEKKTNDNRRPYIKNVRLHRSSELLNANGETIVGSSHYTYSYFQPHRPRELSVYSDEGVYSDYQYPHLIPRCHSTQTLYYL